MTGSEGSTRAAVVGVGTMGENHARVYQELPETTLCGVYDADEARAREVAGEHDTTYRPFGDLLETADVVSVAVPTEYHYETVRECIDAGVDVLVEKPFVADAEQGRKLVSFADERDVVLQVGHVERFNPAVSMLLELVDDYDIIGVSARRLSPPVDRQIDDSAVLDLMIHDVDVLLAMMDDDVADVEAAGTQGGRYATATLSFESGVVGQLTASRVTQQKVRELTLTATDCRIVVDYIDQSLEIRRQAVPEYVREDGSVHYHHESVVEQISVDQCEPLRKQLSSFVEAARLRREPVVTGEDGVRALEVTQRLDRLAQENSRRDSYTPTQ